MWPCLFEQKSPQKKDRFPVACQSRRPTKVNNAFFLERSYMHSHTACLHTHIRSYCIHAEIYTYAHKALRRSSFWPWACPTPVHTLRTQETKWEPELRWIARHRLSRILESYLFFLKCAGGGVTEIKDRLASPGMRFTSPSHCHPCPQVRRQSAHVEHVTGIAVFSEVAELVLARRRFLGRPILETIRYAL